MPLGTILQVKGIAKNEIAYNPAVILQNHKKIIAVRVESLDSDWQSREHYDPHIMFFRREGDALHLMADTPVFVRYEDPWATWITDSVGQRHLLFGAVWVDQETSPPTVVTRLFLAPDVSRLDPYSPVAEIRGMKDVRVCQLPTGRLAVLTRPLMDEMFLGRIGFCLVDNIRDIPMAVAQAPLLKIDMDSNLKIGANEALYLNGKIRVFCHLASRSPDNALHYSAHYFDLDPLHPFDSQAHLSKVCDRSDFPSTPPKTGYLADVVFPGGTGGAGETDFYCGLSDSSIGVLRIINI